MDDQEGARRESERRGRRLLQGLLGLMMTRVNMNVDTLGTKRKGQLQIQLRRLK